MTSDLIKEQLAQLPADPGVYLMKDAAGKIIYVGKATRLRDRVRSYFQSTGDQTEKTRQLVSEIRSLDFFVTASEQEALILENNFIKRYRPHYNIRLKDDKGYPYIRIDVKEDWPTLTYTRRVRSDGARYFGPFTNAWSVKQTLKTLQGIFGYRTCEKEITGTDRRGCLKYFLKRCVGPCIGAVTQEDYRDIIKRTVMFLEGREDEVVADLERKMNEAAEALEFERAARLRDQVQAIRSVIEGQRIAAKVSGEQDVIAFVTERDHAYVQVFFIRESKLIGRESFTLTGAQSEEPSGIMTSFVKQYYDNATYIPRLILLQHPIEDGEAIREWLRQKRGGAVSAVVPARGKRKQLLDVVNQNAQQYMQQEKIRQFAEPTAVRDALNEVQKTIGLARAPARLEGYDISNIQGQEAVGSMVVFDHGRPKPAHYRRFRIKTVPGANDYAMLQEVLRRRFKHVGSADVASPDTWQILPDLVLIDGGKGQLNAVRAAMEEVGAQNIPTASLAKENEEVFVPGRKDGILLPRNSPGLQLLQRVRDEAHRFAVSYHTRVHRKKTFTSALDGVPGIGPKRKKMLMKQFGTVRAIREASAEDLLKVPGMSRYAVEKLRETLA